MKNKNFLKRLILFLVVCSFSARPGFGQAAVCGDVDANGTVNILDALRIAQCVSGMTQCTGITIGDTNCDGSLNIVDALLVARYVAALISQLHCCEPLPTPTPQHPNPISLYNATSNSIQRYTRPAGIILNTVSG
jgi:hypothetical protein